MQPVLVKVDVAAADLGWPARKVFAAADGGDLVTRGLAWVFDFSNGAEHARRELRFWRPELLAHAKFDYPFRNWELDWVIAKILPRTRTNFHAGEVDQLFQIRHNTRLELDAELNGDKRNGANTYSRTNLAAFLTRRWLGTLAAQKTVEQ